MNVITAIPFDENPDQCFCVKNDDSIVENYADYLHDESRLTGSPVKAVFFPTSTVQVCAALRECNRRNWKITTSGGRTGIVGGAVPIESDAIITLNRMDNIIEVGKDSLHLEAGLTLDQISQYVSRTIPGMFYPVDPTETTASIGGTVATNASGARTYYYGATRNWINALTVVLSDGSIIKLRRGEVQAQDSSFVLNFPGRDFIVYELPDYIYPLTKSTAGYELRDGMDAVDLFIGSEGTLGIITEVELKLIPEPKNRLYSVIWAKSEKQTLNLLSDLKSLKELQILALEYFDSNSLNVLREKRIQDGSESVVPKFPDSASAGLFLDLVYENENDLTMILEILENILNENDLSLDDTWSGLDQQTLIRMKAFRHALPETVNEIISQRKIANPNIHKLSTDLAVPNGKLDKMLDFYHDRLNDTGIEHVIFGHIGDNHLHLNMLPKTDDELQKAKILYVEFAKESVRLGGTIAAEHGIGHLKRDLMKILYPPFMLYKMRELKNIFDPKGILNPGVLLPE